MLKSEPKPSRLLENIEKEMLNYNDKRMLGGSNNGGYVMPKIYCLNMDDKKQQPPPQSNLMGLNIFTMGKKIQSAHYNEA